MKEMREPNPAKRALRAVHLKERYVVDPRTIKRWKDSGVLPPADFQINGIDYWFEHTIERNEKENLSVRSRKPNQTGA
jgi:hypothetical protein